MIIIFSSFNIYSGGTMDNRYYINVKKLMTEKLPRPRLKPVIYIVDGEWLPLIDGDTGKIMK